MHSMQQYNKEQEQISFEIAWIMATKTKSGEKVSRFFIFFKLIFLVRLGFFLEWLFQVDKKWMSGGL